MIGCSTEEKLAEQQNTTHEGRVIAIAPVATGSFTNTYIGRAIIYFEDGTNLKVKGDLDLILGGYYIITTIPPINEYWEYLVIDSIIYKP